MVRDVKRQTKKRRPTWRDAATYAVEKISSKSLLRCRYGGDVGLDAAAAIAALDNELARLGIRYEARYLGVRDGRATFRITARYTTRNNSLFDAVRRVGVLS